MRLTHNCSTCSEPAFTTFVTSLFIALSQQQRANQISCTVMSGVHRAKLKLPVIYSMRYREDIFPFLAADEGN